MKHDLLHRIYIRLIQFVVNHFLAGTHAYALKRALLRTTGMKIGDGTQIVGPFYFDFSHIEIGQNCWLGADFHIFGHGSVRLEDNTSIGPFVHLYTGKHQLGPSYKRHLGLGVNTAIVMEKGAMVNARATIVGPAVIGHGAVVMPCCAVCKDVAPNTMVGGVPAKLIKELPDEGAK